MLGDQVIAKILKAEGVEWMAAFPVQTLIDQAAREGIRPILCRQERAGANMADGFSRIKNGKVVGVFTMQTGPGAENAFAGVAQAFADSIPLLLLPGGPPRARTQVHPNFHIPSDLVVDQWASDVECSSSLDFLLLQNLETSFATC